MFLDDFLALIGTNGSGVEGSRGEGLGLTSVRFGFGVVLQLCFGFSVRCLCKAEHLLNFSKSEDIANCFKVASKFDLAMH